MENYQIQYQSDYRPGRLNLVGQQKPDYLLEAIQQEADAWKKYILYADRIEEDLPVNYTVLECMLNAAEQASHYTQQMYRKWNKEQED